MSDQPAPPRLLKREFGLLYGGLFNKIRFPGRYAVDESGNAIQGSAWNAPAIDFTGDIGDLYAEPDTFYIEGDNDLMMRKRKRNEDGEVTETRRTKLGKLDLAATEAMRQEFASNSEIQTRINDQVGRQVNALDTLFSEWSGTAGELSDFQEFLEEELIKPVDYARLDNALKQRIDDKVTMGQVTDEIQAKALLRSEFEDSLNAQNTGFGLELVRESTARTDSERANAEMATRLWESIRKLSEGSGRDVSGIYQALRDNFVTKSFFNDVLDGYAVSEDVQTDLDDKVSKVDYQADKEGPLATKVYVQDYAYQKRTVDNMIEALAERLGSTDTSFNTRLANSVAGIMKEDQFENKLKAFIPNPEQLVQRFQLLNHKAEVEELTDEIEEEARRALNRADASYQSQRNLEDNVFQRLRETNELISSKIVGINGDTEVLKNFFQTIVSDLQDRLNGIDGLLPEIQAPLAVGSDYPDENRTFALRTEVNPLVGRVDTVQNTTIPDLQDQINTDVQNLQGVNGEFQDFRTKVTSDYFDTTNATQRDELIADLNSSINGYTQTEYQTIQDRFFRQNFGPGNYYPAKRAWLKLLVTKPSGTSAIGAAQEGANTDYALTFEDTGGTSHPRFDVPVVKSTEGGNADDSPGEMVNRINSRSDNEYTINLFYSRGDVYVQFPRYSYLGDGNANSVDAKDMRFTYRVDDTTKATNSSTTAEPKIYWRQTLQDYDYSQSPPRRRIDRIAPFILGSGNKVTNSGKFAFYVEFECAPDQVPFSYPA